MKIVEYKDASNNAIYGLGFIGSLIYFISKATTIWLVAIGFFKAVFWPGFLVYYLFQFLLK